MFYCSLQALHHCVIPCGYLVNLFLGGFSFHATSKKQQSEFQINFKCASLTFGHLDVSKNRGTPKSSILIGFSIVNHPFWGTPIFGNTHLEPGRRTSLQGKGSIFSCSLRLEVRFQPSTRVDSSVNPLAVETCGF